AWNDPDLGIDWQLYGQQAVVSDKDSRQPSLSDLGPEALGHMPPSHAFATANLGRTNVAGLSANPS
ncbi:MAG TPA: dTDP-4-dehydrorhamnose 3,5-epimerase, partial [Thalassospira sp.]|nr:dTDP-4-dehydrorhamnose 3,5-epimerase [Thalassospira sp.]